MRNLILSAFLFASAFQTALGEQYLYDDWIFDGEDGVATITFYMRMTGDGVVMIPSEVASYDYRTDQFYGYTVKALGDDFLSGYPSVTSVIIPNSVTSIGSNAFSGCTSLTSITLVDGLPAIGSGWFAGIPVTSITIPNSVTSIGSGAFSGCTSLASVTIGNSVTSIESGTFSGCTSLTSITLVDGLPAIGPGWFAGIPVTSITIPNSVTSIGSGAFSGCPSLTSIIIPNSVTSIGNNAFASATILQRVFLPARFGTTYQNFGLTSAQVILYDPSNLGMEAMFLLGQQNVISNPNTHNLYTSVQYSDNYTAGQTAGRSEVTSFPSSYNLYTATQYGNNYNAGQQNVISNPNTHNLYTTSQIQNMAVGDLVLTREVNGNFVLNYDIEQSDDMANWTVYSANRQIVKLPADKAFVRIKAKQ
jgi:hypothetical protein